MDAANNRQELLSLTTEIVASFAGNNPVATTDLPALISSVFAALHSVGNNQAEQAPEAPVPAVPIKKSVRPDFIICLEDGKKLKMLKRHLASRYNMTPEQYRDRWGLAKDYPIVAPAYAAQRSALAKQIGLGRKAVPAPPPAEAAPAAAKPAPAAAKPAPAAAKPTPAAAKPAPAAAKPTPAAAKPTPAAAKPAPAAAKPIRQAAGRSKKAA